MLKKLGIMLVLCCLVSAAALAEGYTLGDTVEDFTATLSDGTEFTLSEALAEGKPVLLNFWASWCSPCKQEMPAMEEAWQQVRDDAAFVCLSTEPTDTPETIASLREELGLATLQMGLGGFELSEEFDNPSDGIPFTVVIDRNGVLCFSHCGSVTNPALFVRLMEIYTAEDYDAPVLLDRLPTVRSAVEPSSEEEMRKAIGAQDMEIVPCSDGIVWPFVAREGGVYASNTAAVDSYAAFSVHLTAEAGEGVAFEYTVQSLPGITQFGVKVDGRLVDAMAGSRGWTDNVVTFETAGEHEVTFFYSCNRILEGAGDMSAGLRNVRRVSAAQAGEIRAARTPGVRTLEGRRVEIDVLQGEFRDAAICYDGEPFEQMQVLVSELPLRLRIRVGEELDPSYAFVAAGMEIIMLDTLEQDEQGYLLELTQFDREDPFGFGVAVYGSIMTPFEELAVAQSLSFFGSERAYEARTEMFKSCIEDSEEAQKLTWAFVEDVEKQEEPTGSSLNPDGTANYTVLVTDKEGNGIEHVMVQICTDALCQVFFTDANGIVTMTAEPFAYQVHILRAPGFATPEETCLLPKLGGSLKIELDAL